MEQPVLYVSVLSVRKLFCQLSHVKLCFNPVLLMVRLEKKEQLQFTFLGIKELVFYSM